MREKLEEAFKAAFGTDNDAIAELRGEQLGKWIDRYRRFTRLLGAEAWLEAVMMLVPEGWSVKLYIHPADSEDPPVTYADLYLLDIEDRTPDRARLKCFEAQAPTPAEALLAAIEKARTV